MPPSFDASRNEDVEPSAEPTTFAVEKEDPEFAEFRAIIILSPLSLLSIQPTTTLLPPDVTATSLTELSALESPLIISGSPNESPLSDDLANTAVYMERSLLYCSHTTYTLFPL